MAALGWLLSQKKKEKTACPQHEGRPKIMVCVTCNKAVCDFCIEFDHKGHQLQSAETVVKTVLPSAVKDLRGLSVTALKQRHKDLCDILEVEEKQAELTKQEILNRRDKLKGILDELTDIALQKLDQHNKEKLKILDEAKANVIQQFERYKDLRNAVDDLKDPSTIQDHIDVVERGWKIKLLDVTPEEFPNVSRLRFVSDVSIEEDGIIKRLFGELSEEDLNIPTRRQPAPVDTTQTYTESKLVDCFLSASVDTLFLFGDGLEDTTCTQTQSARPNSQTTQLKLPTGI